MQTKFLLLLIFVFACTLQDNDQDGVEPNNQEGAEPNTKTPPFIIDAHVHYKSNDEWEESFLEVYSQYNAIACLLVKTDDLERGINFANEHPDRIVPYAQIDINSPTVLDDIRQVNSMGFRGLGELFATKQWNYNDAHYEPIWALAEELGLLLLPHTGIHSSGNFATMRPSYLAAIATNHRDLTIVGAHFGNPWYSEAGEAARLNPNLYFEMSGSSLIKKSNNPEFWQDILWWTPHIGKAHVGGNVVPAWEKIVFASDEDPSGFEANIIRYNMVFDVAGLPDSTRAKIYGLTMAKLLGIEVDLK